MQFNNRNVAPRWQSGFEIRAVANTVGGSIPLRSSIKRRKTMIVNFWNEHKVKIVTIAIGFASAAVLFAIF